jgi:hypothetical protein
LKAEGAEMAEEEVKADEDAFCRKVKQLYDAWEVRSVSASP